MFRTYLDLTAARQQLHPLTISHPIRPPATSLLVRVMAAPVSPKTASALTSRHARPADLYKPPKRLTSWVWRHSLLSRSQAEHAWCNIEGCSLSLSGRYLARMAPRPTLPSICSSDTVFVRLTLLPPPPPPQPAPSAITSSSRAWTSRPAPRLCEPSSTLPLLSSSSLTACRSTSPTRHPTVTFLHCNRRLLHPFWPHHAHRACRR